MKIYFDYLNIFLLSQKVDSFDLFTINEKLKVIAKLSFLKFLKELKIYLKIIKWLRTYILYCAQKSKTLNKQKTELLRNNSLKDIARKNFSRKRLLKKLNKIKLKLYK